MGKIVWCCKNAYTYIDSSMYKFLSLSLEEKKNLMHFVYTFYFSTIYNIICIYFKYITITRHHSRDPISFLNNTIEFEI